MYVDKKHENVLFDKKPTHRVADLLAESEKAVREGNSQHAYRLSVQATQIAPKNIEAWLLRATLAPTLNERIICVNHLNELSPNLQDRYHVAFFALKELLDRNPYLAYLEETDHLYRVLTPERTVLSIPKKRAAVSTLPPEATQSGPLKRAYGWLMMSVLGLLLAGLGTVVFAPLAVLAALRAQESAQTHSERVSAVVVLVTSFGLFLFGAIFSLLFFLHWMG